MRSSKRLAGAATLALLAAAAHAGGPGVLKFDETSFEVFEESGTAVVTVERSQGEDGAVTVAYSATAGTATAGADFTPVSGTLSWANGDGNNKTFAVPIADDTLQEGAETIDLALSDPSGGAAIDSVRGTSTVVVLASDGGSGGGDDGGGAAGVLHFDENDYLAFEGAGQAIITVERSEGEQGTVTVDYRTAGGSATAGSDYTVTSGALSWGPGEEGLKTFSVPIRRDELTESGEDFEVVLGNPTGGAAIRAGGGTATVSILDDDTPGGDDSGGAGVIEFDESSVAVIEGNTATIKVERSHGESGTVSVRYSTEDGSGTAGADYTAATGILTWASGDGAAKSFPVTTLADAASEGSETVHLTLSDPTGGATLDELRQTAVLDIMDADGQTSPCDDDPTHLCLLANRFKVEVTWRTGQGQTGPALADQLSDNSGTFWFFDAGNRELLLKVLDACAPFGSYWVFFSATTDVGFTVEVTDTATGVQREYSNPAGMPAPPVTDTSSFKTCS